MRTSKRRCMRRLRSSTASATASSYSTSRTTPSKSTNHARRTLEYHRVRLVMTWALLTYLHVCENLHLPARDYWVAFEI